MAKTVVITGGTAGIGLATAETFARDGWNVGILARGEERLREVEARLRALGVQALGISADVSDAEAVDAAAERFETNSGRSRPGSTMRWRRWSRRPTQSPRTNCAG